METKSEKPVFPALSKRLSKIILLSTLAFPLASQAADDTYMCGFMGVGAPIAPITVKASSAKAAEDSLKSTLDEVKRSFPYASLACVKK